MVRKTRRMPAVISTIALIAGCGSDAHAEVSGVVVDARTGRAIPGARVVAQDGSATRTDADGRFTISLARGGGREIRASAAGRVDARARIDVRVDENASIVIELVACPEAAYPEAAYPEAAPSDPTRGPAVAWDEHGAHDPDAVLRWIDDLDLEQWLVRGVREPDAEPAELRAAWGAGEQWALGAMTLDAAPADASCAGCHDASAFAAAHDGGGVAAGAEVAAAQLPSACAACHDTAALADGALADRALADGALADGPLADEAGAGSPGERFGLRVYEDASAVAGAPARGLGSGAVCVECHRGVEDAWAHAPQADVVLGRGARTTGAIVLGGAPHGAIADACVACHAAPWREADAEALSLGHTFAVREAGGDIARDACSACHGEVRPESIAAGDWDGDGVRGALADEHDRALARARAIVEARVRRARVRARCGTAAIDASGRGVAAGFREHEGAVVLVDVRGVMLGDCDEDGVIGARERATTVDALPRAVRDAAWDVMLLERDGSRGVHNPSFAFGLLGAIESRL